MTEPQGTERMHRAILRTLNELAAAAAEERLASNLTTSWMWCLWEIR